MKVILSFLLLIGLTVSAQDQKAKKPSPFQKWPELKEFHTVMSQTFHPSEEGNLKPIKERSSEMASKAKTLASSTFPAEFNNDKIRDAVKRLVDGSFKLDDMISNKASDDDIKTSLAKLHDVFHEIVGLCRDDHAH